MEPERCYFCKNVFSQLLLFPNFSQTCTVCQPNVKHIKDSYGNLDTVNMSIVYEGSKYILEFFPSYGNALYIVKPSNNTILELIRPQNFGPQMAEQYLTKILKMKAFL